MAVTKTQNRDGTIMIISDDSYAPFGATSGEAPTETYRPPRTLREDDVRKRCGNWSADQLQTAIDYCGFPKGLVVQRTGFSWNITRWREWREHDVDVWLAHSRSLNLN